jgi:hypothetical protein
VRNIFASALLSFGIALAAPSASQAMMTKAPVAMTTNLVQVDYDVYRAPREGGASLDWCVSYAHGCGWPAAHRFCHQMGFPRATRWRVYHPGETYVPVGPNHYCRGSQCQALGNVECSY